MAIEVSCGQCSGRLLVETPGAIVACPHCGVHLSVPLPTSPSTTPNPPVPSPPSLSEDHKPAWESDLHEIRTLDIDEPASARAETIVISNSSANASDQMQKPQNQGEDFKLAEDFHAFDEDDETDIKPSFYFGWPIADVQSSANESSDHQFAETPNLAATSSDNIDPVQTWPPSEPTESQPEIPVQTAPSTPQAEQIPAFALNHLVQTDLTQNTTIETLPEVTTTTPVAIGPDFSWMGETNQTAPASTTPQFSFCQNLAMNEPSGTSFSAETAPMTVDAIAGMDFLSTAPASATEQTFKTSFDPNSHESMASTEAASPVVATSNDFWQTLGQSPSIFPNVQDQPAPDTGFASLGAIATTVSPSAVGQVSSSEPNDESSEKPVFVQDGGSQSAWPAMLLIIVGSYASLITIYLVYLTFFGGKHQLESLPDLKTVQQLGGRAIVPRPENDLPKWHQLRFGESQRYGNIRVTPLRVTRGPLQFVHISGDATIERSPSAPVLKMWLKFENVSRDQTIVPIDTTLMFFRRIFENRVVSYNVIFRPEDRHQKQGQFWYPFDRMSEDTEWMIVGQHTNESLSPSQSVETFIPSEENFEGLKGAMVWRVHIRKGHGSATGNGVTTLVDVLFNTDDIQPDPA